MKKRSKEYRAFLEAFSAYLEHYKQATGKTQKEIGKLCGRSQKCISENIRGKAAPTSETLFQILNATGSQLDESVFRLKLREVKRKKA